MQTLDFGDGYALHVGDCLEVMRAMSDNSIDAIVCDPPYGLSPDGKARTWDDIAELRAQGKGPRGGFMGRAWDAAVPGVTWARECLRILKPGGHLIAFSSTRTSGRLMCALEDGGFEIRDTIHWLHYQGFPKSRDVSKDIDKAAGAEREVVGRYVPPGGKAWNLQNDTARSNVGAVGHTSRAASLDITAPATDDAKRWHGWGTALKPAIEPAILARKPLDAFTPEETSAILGSDHLWSSKSLDTPAKRAAAAKRWGWGVPIPEGAAEWTGRPLRRGVAGIKELRAGGDVIATMAGPEYRAAKISTVMVNVLRWGTGALNVDACRYAEGDRAWPGPTQAWDPEQHKRTSSPQPMSWGDDQNGALSDPSSGRWPANLYHCPKPSRREREAGTEQLAGGNSVLDHRAEGSAGLQSPRAGAGRTAGKLGNHHPTTKAVTLMRWLLRLVTPPGGVAFDPFAGSGTTLVAGVQEGITVIGAELSDEYVPIIEARTLHALRERAKGSR